MLVERISSIINYEPSLIAKIASYQFNSSSPSSLSPPIFILCDVCYWCATYIDKTRIPIHNVCPQCGSDNSELTCLPIMSNESFTFDHNPKRGIELEFKPRRKHT
jgi:hypothetical protein